MSSSDAADLPQPPAPTYRYDVFISYRHRELDTEWANWLIRALEGYWPPRSLVASLRSAGRPYKISRVFRDEDETAAGGDLSEKLKEALKESRSLAVICSRNTPGSTWVDREIEYYESLGRATRVLPLLVEGEPEDSFPSALRNRTSAATPGAVATVDSEPLAADARPRKDLSNREVKHRALLKIVAGALDVKYDDLYERDRRRRRNRLIGAGAVAALVLTVSLSWFAWTRTDAYQLQTVRATAPQLLPSALGEDVANWSRALVMSGHFDEGVAAAEKAGDSGGDKVTALLATAEAARAMKRESDADRLMVKAAELSKNYKPGFSMELRLNAAKSLFKQGQSKEAKSVIVAAIADVRNVPTTEDKVKSLRQFASLLVEMGDKDYLRQLTQNEADPVVASVASLVAGEMAAKAGQPSEARRLTSLAIEASQRKEVGAHQPYLLAVIVDSAASAGLLTTDNGALKRALKLARQLPNSQERSRAQGQIAAAMSRLRRLDEAMAVRAGIADQEERNNASEIVAKAFARNGKPEGVRTILKEYPDDGGLDRYSIVSGMAEGLAEGRQMRILPRLEDLLSAHEKVEVRIVALETWRKSGTNAERDEVLNQALRIAQSAEGDEDQQEMLSRIAGEMIEGGRVDDAVIVARAMSDPHGKTFALLGVAKKKLAEGKIAEMRELLTEAAAAEEKTPDADLRAAGFREIGAVFRSTGDKPEAMKLLRRSVAAASEGGEYGSSTAADVAEQYARLGELRLARTIADRYCQDSDRLRVYATILLQSRGIGEQPE